MTMTRNDVADSGSTDTRTTFCRVCHASCPMEVDVVDNRVVAVRGVPDDPIFAGYTCIKGRQLPDQMRDPGRLRAPLRRREDGGFDVITSTEALDEIGAILRRIIDTHGPRAVASYTGTGGYQNSVAVPAARAFQQGFHHPRAEAQRLVHRRRPLQLDVEFRRHRAGRSVIVLQ